MITIREVGEVDKNSGLYKSGYAAGQKLAKSSPQTDMFDYSKDHLTGESRNYRVGFIQGFKDVAKRETTVSNDKIEALLAKYEAKDYFSDKEMIDGKIKGWIAAGSPKELKGLSGEATEESIREFLEKREHEQRVIWMTGRVKRLNDKNATEIAEWLRSDQKMMKELFQIVTGVNVTNMNNAQLKVAIAEWCKKPID